MGHTRRYYKNKKRNKTKNKHIRFKQNLAIENKKQDLNFHKEFVLNLSKRDITETEFKVIAKGLKFVPTNKCNHRQLIKDFQSFERSLRLKYYFGTNIRIATKNHPFKIKSNFQVPIIGDNSIEKYIFYTKHELSNYMPTIKYNMSKSERECIKKLKIDNTICIHKADKNNTTVIQNKRDYLTEGESQLNDGIHYTKIINIDIENTRKIVNKLVYRMKENDEIDEMSFKFLREEGKTFKTPKAYFLPKIHKLSTETLEMYQNKSEHILCYDFRTQSYDEKRRYKDCTGMKRNYFQTLESGVYEIYPDDKKYVQAYCDMSTDGGG
ncbi:unnamed protein product [Mytilus edulis]|uniref:Fibrinogen C-terminal domain-containing protein n=1 Tax=Mytilus edulis TaxID=6550 RepID=A0A8S3U7R3_MYTED|nr:unnamed protein product [Mytilus edulis]